MELEVKKIQTVNAKTLKIHAKCTDCCSTSLVSDKGEVIHNTDGYVPGFMPGSHYGEYLILDIDLDTGTILNWKKPSASTVQEWITENPNED